VVYGPWGGRWTTLALERLPADAAALPSAAEPAGVCNAVYVDDVVSAAILAATVPEANGGRFLISGAPTTWGAFYDGFRAMVGVTPPARPALENLPSWEQDLYASRATASTRHARDVLGFSPAVDLERGMTLVEAWANWSGLISQTTDAFSAQRARASIRSRLSRRVRKAISRR
jgi:nucleoside-diphosphate-sugar epimerase